MDRPGCSGPHQSRVGLEYLHHLHISVPTAEQQHVHRRPWLLELHGGAEVRLAGGSGDKGGFRDVTGLLWVHEN